ncbi:MAG: apiosidase-like domain-containing protein [Planctomycetota bacterium]
MASNRYSYLLIIALAVGYAGSAAMAQLIFDDPLTNGTTIGVRDNGLGTFDVGVGWRVVNYNDNIRYTPAYPIKHGAVEFEVKGLINNDDLNPDGQLMNMYDASWGNPRFVYAPDIRLNPFKMVWHRYGDDGGQYHEDEFKLILKTDNVLQFETYAQHGPYNWNGNTWYSMRCEWKDGIMRFYRDGQDSDRWPNVYRSIYAPPTHDIRIGTNTRNNAIINAVYRNVKIYDYQTVPSDPYINNPEGVTKTLNPTVDWVGDRHDNYEVHITSGTDPNSGIVRDSGQVTSPNSYYVVTGALSNSTTYYAHVRLRNNKGWGSWSDPQQFQTNTGGTIYVDKYSEYEVVLVADADYPNPYLDVTLSATFNGPGQTIIMSGFWDGGRLYKIRMLPTVTGTWTWTTSSNRSSLNNQSGSFICQSSTNKGYVRVSSAYPYTFEWAGDGTPFFLMGDTVWHMYYNLRYADGTFQSLIDDRAAQHFNYAHGVVHDFLHNEGGAIYSAQDEVLETFNCDTLNPDYFKWIDKKIDYMNSKGMVASMFFAWGNEGYEEYTSAAQYMRYERYLVARYASKNVIWIIVGEFEEPNEPNSRWIDYMNEVYNNDPYKHPISLHTVQTTDRFGNETAHSFVSQQRMGTPEELRGLIAGSRVYNKPVVNLEYGYEGDPAHYASNQPADDVRKDHYALVLAGGYGVYGNHTPWYSTYHRVADFVLEATDTDGAEYMKLMYEFFEDTNFWRLSPAQNLVDTGICARWADNEYIVQLLNGGTVNVNMSEASGTFYEDWWNPVSGVRIPNGTRTGGGSRAFTAPDTSHDWILHVHKHEIVIDSPVPIIDATPTSGDPPLVVSFDASSSYDPNGTITGYEWDLDDDGIVDSTSVSDSYTYTAMGTYHAQLTVTDNDFNTSTTSAQITVGNPVYDPTLSVKPAGSITIDGGTDDWNLGEFVSKVRGGEDVLGDIALVGYDGGQLYYAGYATGNTLPTSGSDHTAKVYSRHDTSYLYYLIRCDDDDIQTDEGTQGDNWRNDCVEFYIDPSHDGGASPMSSSTSDIQLVIDAANRQNVYVTTSGYRTQILNGVTSVVTTDGAGWWLEARISKSALDPDLPADGTVGVDFNFRDNDDSNNSSLTTVYTWADNEQSGGFPSKIPDRWGDAVLADLTPTPPGPAANPNPANLATGVDINADLSWTPGVGATSHDVYFGTVNPPGFQNNQAGNTYDPGTLAYSTTYYWQIDEVNIHGTTTGTVWSFTTMAEPPLPGQASNPSPTNLATDVSVATDLSWTAGSDATSYDVYLGTVNPPPFQNDPGILASNTTYYWRINSVNAVGTTTGAVWSFTTWTTPSAKMFEPFDWTFSNPSYSGNPYDLVATATFTHATESNIQTELYYDGGNDWKLRFTGTAVGLWSFTTASSDSDLNGLSGSIVITDNPGVPGFTRTFSGGNRWGRTGTDEAYVPQFAMFYNVYDIYNDPSLLDDNISMFLGDHGFNGLHTAVFCRWFDISKEYNTDIPSMDPNPDPLTFEMLEDIILRTHEYGGVVHIWPWGDDQHDRTVTKWGTNGAVDQRLQRYICARLGPLPGWSMGYGYDCQEWVSESDLIGWHNYMQSHLGWPHFLGARDVDMQQIYTGLDYSGYQQWLPDYDTYVTGIEVMHPGKPTFFEDRFRVREDTYYRDFKDYTEEMTRRGLWHSTLAGGAANIWGYRAPVPPSHGCSLEYPNKHWMKTAGVFWKGRFTPNMVRDNSLTNGYCLRDGNSFYVFYKEDTTQITMNLTGMSGTQPAYAVDCTMRFELIPLGTYTAANQTYNAPYSSDWAVVVGGPVPGDPLSVDLALVDAEDGIYRRNVDDGDTMVTTIGGRECRRNAVAGSDNYIYFSVSGSFSYEGSNPDLYITIEYYDTGTGSLTLHYDSPGAQTSDKYKDGGSVTLGNTDTWKSHTFNIADAYFGNRQNSNSDFRIYGGSGNIFYLDMVSVSDTPPVLSPVAVINANPTGGLPPLQVGFDASNSYDPNGIIVSYEWDFEDDGTIDSTSISANYTYTSIGNYVARLTVTDNDGLDDSDTVSIAVAFVASDFDKDGDVDLEDFGRLQACYVGDGVLAEQGCEDKDLDGDQDVDTADFDIFEGCLNGANNSPGCL